MRSLTSSVDTCEAARVIRCPIADLHSLPHTFSFILPHRKGFGIRMTQEECIREIDRGNTFFVVGADGSEAEVKVFIHFPPWEPRGIRYIATVADDSTEDNLLSLPECP